MIIKNSTDLSKAKSSIILAIRLMDLLLYHSIR